MTLDEEKQKLEFSHKLEIRRVWLEKGLWTIIIALAGFAANLWFEGYKSDLNQSRFLLEARMEALRDLRVSYSALSQHAFAEMENLKPAGREAYGTDLQAFFHAINRSGFLFSDEFIIEISHHAWLHQAIADPRIQITREHWSFLIDVAQAFDSATRQALVVEVLGSGRKPVDQSFKLRTWKQEDVVVKGVTELFQDNFKKWRTEKNR